MTSANDDGIFGDSILYSEAAAVRIDILARRLRRNGSASWAADYDRLAAEHAADAGSAMAREEELAVRLEQIRSR